MSDEGFLRAILDNPEDDTPRLIYADWLEERGDPRGEFIRVQYQLADPTIKGNKRWRVRARETALLKAHEEAWAGCIRQFCKWWQFRRGFVEVVTIETEAFLANAEALFRATPIRHLAPVLFGDKWSELVRSPYLARLALLELTSSYVADHDVGPRILLALLESPRTVELRGLAFNSFWIDEPVLAALADCPHLTGLNRLGLSGCGIGDRGLAALYSSPYLTGLSHLDIRSNNITNQEAGNLAASPVGTRLQRLFLGRNHLRDLGTQALAASPHLAGLLELDLMYNGISDAGANGLAASPSLGKLSALHLGGNNIGAATREALKKRFTKGVCSFATTYLSS